MAAYAPGDALAYLEINDLPTILSGITQTQAWETLYASGSSPRLQRVNWLSRVAFWTGIGSSEQVILSRAQFAVVVVGLEAVDNERTLLIRPAAALIIETHTSPGRMMPVIEKSVGDLAHRIYPQSTHTRKIVDGFSFTEWISTNDNRSIVLGFFDTEAIIGNSEKAVLACIAARREGAKSLMGNSELQLTRSKLRSDTAVAFGYLSTDGLGKLVAALAPTHVEGLATSPQAQQILAGLTGKLFKSAGWSLRFQNRMFEDSYFVAAPQDLTTGLQESTGGGTGASPGPYLFLPQEVYSVTEYRVENPSLAWRGLNRALSSHLDIIGAVLVTPLLKSTLAPYGIDQPEVFLEAIGGEILTARLDEDGANSVLIVKVKEEKALRGLVAQRLGVKSTKENVSGYEMLVSVGEDSLAASFVDQYLVMGSSTAVRSCLITKSRGESLSSQPAFKHAIPAPAPSKPVTVTYTRDIQSTSELFSLISNSSNQQLTYADSFRVLPYAVTTTAIGTEGFERVTRSSSGLLGTLAGQIQRELSSK
ncbi:MAG: hypothetical protein QOE77_3436 [Blastocatellia bacterium]|nr:hypothetical protein [Blastocatellia bacterium]